MARRDRYLRLRTTAALHKLSQAQEAVAASLMDGWLVYDFRHSNPLLWQLLVGVAALHAAGVSVAAS